MSLYENKNFQYQKFYSNGTIAMLSKTFCFCSKFIDICCKLKNFDRMKN